jgi:hypothetical protein
MAATTRPTPQEGSRRFRWLPVSPGLRLAVGVAVGFIALIGGTIWKMRSLDGLPDVGDLFDVAEARRPVEIPDADNAFVAYAAAGRQLVKPPKTSDEIGWDLFCAPVRDGAFKTLAWSSTTPKHREYLEARRAALETWREGCARPDAVYHQPGRITLGAVMNLIDEAALLAGMAALEGSRLEDAGALEEAWGWYGAILRCSRLVGRHGTLLQRNHGAKIHALAGRCILRWASDPRVGAGQLRRALHETLTADALTPPISESVRIEYLMCLKSAENVTNLQGIMMDLGRPIPILGGRQPGLLDQLVPWRGVKLPLQRIRLGLSNEPERTRRVFRILFANWLAQADRPPARQAPLAIRTPTWLHADDPSAPAAARAVSPEVLAQALDRLELAFLFDPGSEPGDPPWAAQGELTRELRRRSVLIVRLAAELYRREHGALPSTAGDLLGTTLQELPEGIAADDPIPAGLE